jgi:AcrR family transcriptional regulator
MPKVVDHEKQRERFADAAIQIIVRNGLAALTMREVAQKAGLSHGLLFHYFGSKEQLLIHTVRCLVRRQVASHESDEAQRPGVERLRRLLVRDAVVNDEVRSEAAVWLAFRAEALVKAELQSVHSQWAEHWIRILEEQLEAAQAAGEMAADLDPRTEALALSAYSAGIMDRALLQPERFPPETQRALIDRYLERLVRC